MGMHSVSFIAIASFAYISDSLERHSLTGSPRLSSLLVLLLSGSLCFAISVLSKWLPIPAGRVATSEYELLDNRGHSHGHAKQSRSSASVPLIPDRPRRYSLPVLIFCIVLRLEAFHRVNYQQQCSTPGVESFLCFLLFAHEVFTKRRKWGVVPLEDEVKDPWRSSFDDIYDWFSSPRVTMLLSGLATALLALGTFKSLSQITRSTYFCYDRLDSTAWVVFLQLFGLGLDVYIAASTWKILAWARTTEQRLQVLGTVLSFSSLSMGFVWVGSKIAHSGNHHQLSFGFRSLYGFDIILDSIIFAALVISAALWICDTSPMIVTTSLTMIVAAWSSINNVFSWGDWQHTLRPGITSPPWLIACSAVIFLYFQDIRRVFFVHRILIALILLLAATGASVYVSVRAPVTYDKAHPINDLIYRGHIEHDRWLRTASVSQTLALAATTYIERHGGRFPPPNFPEWYRYAEGTVIIDEFPQIDRDLAPFWDISPETLRRRVDLIMEEPGVATITIKQGVVSHSQVTDAGRNQDLQDLVAMIGKFSKHLPDMTLPINLDTSPRILPTWEDAHPRDRAIFSSVGDVISKRSTTQEDTNDIKETNITNYAPLYSSNIPADLGMYPPGTVSASDYRQMLIDGCSPLSRTRTSPQWNFAQFCSNCVQGHSTQQLLTNWVKAMDTCSQPDLNHLHGLFMTRPKSAPIRTFLPLFSTAKTDSFSDIIIPSPRVTRADTIPDIDWYFRKRYDSLFWAGTVARSPINQQALHGSHKYRLLHLLTRPNLNEDVTLVLPHPQHTDKFVYEKIPAMEASKVAPFAVSLGNYSSCAGTPNCHLLKLTYGGEGDHKTNAEPLEHRYVLILDEDDGPSAEHQMRTIRSNSVPFISSIFTTWYTNRIRPWVHFIPVDPRYQALHTTYLYFTGTENRGSIAGRDTNMKGALADAEWIAQGGRKWAEEALGERDMEVYLFRLLLEWGRLIDDDRDKIGYRRTNIGFENLGFSRYK